MLRRQSISPTKYLILLLINCIFLSSSCGYRPVSYPAKDSKRFLTVAVPYFDNRTMEPEIDAIITETLRRELSMSGFQIGSEREADIVIKGVIERVDIAPVGFNREDISIQNRLTVGINIMIIMHGKVIVEKTNLVEKEEYYVDRNLQVIEGNKKEAIIKIAKRLSGSIKGRFLRNI